MPKAVREYYHCIRCEVPLENPNIKRMDTEVWFFEFTICPECCVEMLKMDEPAITAVIEGDVLKKCLRAKRDHIVRATALGDS